MEKEQEPTVQLESETGHNSRECSTANNKVLVKGDVTLGFNVTGDTQLQDGGNANDEKEVSFFLIFFFF